MRIVHTVSGTLKNVVSIEGAIKKSGRYSFGDEITLGNLININNDILDETYLGYAVVKGMTNLQKDGHTPALIYTTKQN